VAGAGAPKRKSAGKARAGGLFRRIDPLTSVMLVFPLFLLYEVGILVVPTAYNGADLFTAQIVRLLHGNVGLYVLLNGALLAIFVGLLLYFRRDNTFHPRLFFPVVLESAIYALTMGSLILFVMVDLLHVDPRLVVALPSLSAGEPRASGLLASLVVSLGAGVHEELIFRVVLIGGAALVIQKVFGTRRGIALALCFIGSSVLFSAAHHVIGGEPVRIGVFVYRVLCGFFFAALYQFRGLAIAVYTHALYDIYVFMVKG